MIAVRLCGGLGNQLFQYAAGRTLSLLHDTDLVIDTSWYDSIPFGDTPRSMYLDRLRVVARRPSSGEALRFRLHNGRVVGRLPIPRSMRQVRERSFGFDYSVLEAGDNSYLYGYWQSYRYFESHGGLIAAEVVSRDSPSGRYSTLVSEVLERESVSVHVRRGDYVANPNAARVHGLCSPDYYARALQVVRMRLKDPLYCIFSDDIEWARDNIHVPGDVRHIGDTQYDTTVEDMNLMAHCHHHVIANSSFSWWGAWLGSARGGNVFAPAQWFTDGRDSSDLCPPSWVRL